MMPRSVVDQSSNVNDDPLLVEREASPRVKNVKSVDER